MSMTIEKRREMMLDAAIELVRNGHHYRSITRIQLANHLNMVPSHVHRVFSTMDNFKDAVVKHALEINDCTVIVQAISVNDPLVIHVPATVKKHAMGVFL